MHTLQIAEAVLDGHKNEKLSDERIDFLKTQANEQLDEMSQNKEIFDGFLKQINASDGGGGDSSPSSYYDPALFGILGALILMFIVMCVVLQLFAK